MNDKERGIQHIQEELESADLDEELWGPIPSEGEVEHAAVSNDERIRKKLRRLINLSYESGLFARRLGISFEELQELRIEEKVFHFEVGGTQLYPKWQIQEGKLVEGVNQLAHLLSDTASPLGAVQWAMGRNRLLENRTPAECLREGLVPQVLDTAESFLAGEYV